jgi:hypothetical protein
VSEGGSAGRCRPRYTNPRLLRLRGKRRLAALYKASEGGSAVAAALRRNWAAGSNVQGGYLRSKDVFQCQAHDNSRLGFLTAATHKAMLARYG